MEKLIVKNFGAIRNVELQLKDLTIFIGETGTGKSILAKLVSIFRNTDFWEGDIRNVEFFKSSLGYYQIANFLEPGTIIEYQSEIGFYFIYNEFDVRPVFSEDTLKYLEKNTVSQMIEEDKLPHLIKELVRGTFKEVIYLPAER
jgi:predicted ATPase